jgi:hypothetical protein
MEKREKEDWFTRFITVYFKNFVSMYVFTGIGVVIIVLSYVWISLAAFSAPPADNLLPSKVVLLVGVGMYIIDNCWVRAGNMYALALSQAK